jgi:hypothetical protein
MLHSYANDSQVRSASSNGAGKPDRPPVRTGRDYRVLRVAPDWIGRYVGFSGLHRAISHPSSRGLNQRGAAPGGRVDRPSFGPQGAGSHRWVYLRITGRGKSCHGRGGSGYAAAPFKQRSACALQLTAANPITLAYHDRQGRGSTENATNCVSTNATRHVLGVQRSAESPSNRPPHPFAEGVVSAAHDCGRANSALPSPSRSRCGRRSGTARGDAPQQ